MNKYLFALFAIIPILNNSVAQKNQPFSAETYEEYQNQFRYYVNTNTDSALLYCTFIRSKNNPIYTAYSYAAEAYLKGTSGDDSETKKLLNAAFLQLKKIPPSAEKTNVHATILNFAGSIDKYQEKYQAAASKYIEGAKMARSIGDKSLEIRFIHNIADVTAKMGNLKEAISESRKELILLEASQSVLTPETYSLYKSNSLINLGKFYNDSYHLTGKKAHLDSAQLYYTKARSVSSNLAYNNCSIDLNLGGIALTKKHYATAILLFKKVVSTAKSSNYYAELKLGTYNLAIAYYESKAYQKALDYFHQIDTYYLEDSINLEQFVQSNYFQSKIYKLLGEPEKAYTHSDIYLENYAVLLRQQSDMQIGVSELLTQNQHQKEMESLRKSLNTNQSTSTLLIISGGGFFSLFILLLFFKSRKEKRSLQSEVKLLQHNIDEKKSKTPPVSTLKIDDQTEQELIIRLKKLELDHFFLRSDFNLQTVSKRIKTNTTYLSHIVNKQFQQTFSEYSNDLKINYVIDQMKTNPKYREYSTQAIAESVGFKNAVSFTKSFSKKTGYTPYQYSRLITEGTLKV